MAAVGALPAVVAAPPPSVRPASTTALRRGAVASALTTRAGVRPDVRVRLRLRCRTTTMGRCRGTLTLRARLPGGRGRTATIARASFAAAAGARTLTLRLRTRAHRALRARTRLAATSTVATRQPGGASTSRSRRITLCAGDRQAAQAHAATAISARATSGSPPAHAEPAAGVPRHLPRGARRAPGGRRARAR